MLGGGLPGEHEDAGADDGSDAQRDQIERPQRTLQAGFTLVLRLVQQLRHRLDRE